MGKITNFLKSSAGDMTNQIKNIDISNQINSALGTTNITNFKMPNLDTSELTKGMKFDTKLSDVKLPGGMTNYLPPVVSKIFGEVKLPSEIGGVPLPQLPDLSSVTDEVESFLSGIGFNTNTLGIRSITDILKEPDLSSLKNVQFDTRSNTDVNVSSLDDIPDISSLLNGFDVSGLQGDINQLTTEVPEMNDFDISKYF